MMSKKVIFGHSPDSDDAFMYYGIASGNISLEGYKISHQMEDIESLNLRSEKGELDVTAISVAHYPKVSNHYQIMNCGSSVGRNYGPVLVSKNYKNIAELKGKVIAIPGKFTTSYMLFQIFVEKDCEIKFMHFEKIMDAIDTNEVDAGVLLHEGQILFQKDGFNKILDLGEEWFKETKLPIPLGVDLVNRKFDLNMRQKLTDVFYNSVKFAIDNEDEALKYAMEFGRNLSFEEARKFVRMYVNSDTLDMGKDGYEAILKLFNLAKERGIISEIPEIDLIFPKY
jgi:1,4-dihydroxy-6-naphthoate synthase